MIVKKEVSTKKEASTKKEVPGQTVNDGVSRAKKELIYNILKRWWYCMPDWPPVDYDYSEKLKENQLRKVELALWKLEPNFDDAGNRFLFRV